MIRLRFDSSKRYADPREMPAYSIPAAAHHLRLPPATLRSWVLGRTYQTQAGPRKFKPIIRVPDPAGPLLSFFNLVEAHVLRGVRVLHRVSLHDIRRALDYLGKQFNSEHPLIEHRFETDGVHMFVRRLGKLIDASSQGQTVFVQVMGDHLKRLEFDDGRVVRLYPFTRPGNVGPKKILIDPRLSFGRPVLAKMCIPVDVIGDRYKAGESIDELAEDYGCERLEIEEAIRYELPGEAA